MEGALLFPGQGSQSERMREDVRGGWPELWDIAREAVGEDPLSRADDATRFAQPAIVCASLARWAAAGRPVAPFMAGHSLGELAALVAADSLDAADAVRLAARRGELMERASAKAGGGGMLALVGPVERGRELAEGHGLAIANENSPSQLVVSGPADRLAGLEESAQAEGLRAVRLRVSGPFHSAAMAPAVEPFREALAETEVRPPATTVISGVTARAFDDVRARLAEALVNPVRWRELVEALSGRGVRRFVETGPGRVLGGLVRRTLDGVETAILPDPAAPARDEAAHA